MGILTDLVKAVAPGRLHAVGATVPLWADGVPQTQGQSNYNRYALEGFSQNEVVFACISMLASSAAEPRMAAYRNTAKKPEPVENAPILDVLDNPNPFLSRYDFWATIMMYLAIAGNAYVEKVRSASGQVVELWLLRPDRVRVIPDARTFVGGYQYQIGADWFILPAGDVIHFKTRNPYDDYYGLPPLAVAARRVDTDNFMREFTASFFRNAGVPSGLLTISRTVEEQERAMIQNRFRGSYGGPAGWNSLMVLDGESGATYQQMGMPLGERGLVLPELDEINETRICQVFGVRPSLIGAKVGTRGSGLAGGSRRADSEAFWDETLVPIYRQLAADMTRGLVHEFTGIDYLEFDLSDVRALQPDEDAIHDRVRKDMLAGIITREEARVELGHDPEPDASQTWVLPSNIMPEPVTPEEPDPNALPPGTVPVDPRALAAGTNGPGTNGRVPALNGAGQNGRAN